MRNFLSAKLHATNSEVGVRYNSDIACKLLYHLILEPLYSRLELKQHWIMNKKGARDTTICCILVFEVQKLKQYTVQGEYEG